MGTKQLEAMSEHASKAARQIAERGYAAVLTGDTKEAAITRMTEAIEQAISASTAELVSRLNEAEKIVDHAIAHTSYAGTRIMAQEYSTQYPRVEEEPKRD